MPRKPKHFIIENESLMREWDYEKNDLLSHDPTALGMSSHTKVWWRCEKGHSWFAMISNRSGHDRGCPYCSHQLPICGATDLATQYPELIREWHPTKNTFLPSEILPGTHKKAWWICPEGHEYESAIKSRVGRTGCPYCCGKKVLAGFNDLKTVDPDLAAEWHPTLNGDLTPEDVTDASGKKVWWICKNGHVYESTVHNRKSGRGCPKCSDSLRTSFPEQAIYFYIKQQFSDAISGYKDIFNSSMELDIYIPSIKVGIEYDGRIYHSSANNQIRDQRKYHICKQNGIFLVRVCEMTRYSPIITCNRKIEIPNASDKYLNWAIYNLCFHLGKLVLPDVRRDRRMIQAYLDKRNTSLAIVFPLIAAEWDYQRNAPLIPENFAPHSNEKVGWICSKCGHKWDASIGDRTRVEATGCPVCAKANAGQTRNLVRLGERGSLAKLFPELLKEWDFERNLDISPDLVTTGTSKKAWWKCKACGYEWYGSISNRVRGRGCPYCNHRVVIPGKNDLATLRPELLKDWDYEKNIVDPTTISIGSGKRAYWRCSVCNHEWSAVIASRAKGVGCPNYRSHK